MIKTIEDVERLAAAAAEEFVQAARAAIAARQRFTVALAGGSTPRRTYELLAAAPYRDQVDWARVEFFWGDERGVAPDHNDSNFHMANEALLRKLAVPGGHVHRMSADRTDREGAARDYEAELARVFGCPGPPAKPPSFDLLLLGMGPDAHTLSLFPGTQALQETPRWVVPNFVPKFADKGDFAHRLTFTKGMANAAARVVFTVGGADKAVPLAEVLEGPPDPDRLPSQTIRPAPGQLVWLVERAAAARLTKTSS
ncbi:MAG: 6-phosphogluconolactonase [Planctomycetes bacterium]|nr:6-phosphogluconolactonase [Planctomycetota bacterium]